MCRVWTEAVAVLFREWRALMSWLRGTIIWKGERQEKTKSFKYDGINTTLESRA